MNKSAHDLLPKRSNLRSRMLSMPYRFSPASASHSL
jgi:hypothetical protein